jgi:RNA polymerase sigma-70 factor (ECF subfamily)
MPKRGTLCLFSTGRITIRNTCHNRWRPRVIGLNAGIEHYVDFDALFQKLYPSLFRYLHRLTGDADVAEDIAQEAFVRLLRQSLPEGEIRPWLFTVAMNLVRDHARKTDRRQRLLTSAPTLVTPSALPDESVERAERVTRVRQVLERLPVRDRQLLLMREEGFRYEEIAAVIGVAPASVGTLIARALKRFADVYQSREAGDVPLH